LHGARTSEVGLRLTFKGCGPSSRDESSRGVIRTSLPRSSMEPSSTRTGFDEENVSGDSGVSGLVPLTLTPATGATETTRQEPSLTSECGSSARLRAASGTVGGDFTVTDPTGLWAVTWQARRLP